MQAKAKFEGARISFKNSLIICKAIRGLSLAKGKKFLEDLIAKKRSLDGKYYCNAAEKILEILENAEANAKQQNLNLEKLFIFPKVDKGFRLITPKSRAKFRGRKAKVTNIEIILKER
jgi:ribosomal protein L22